MRDTRATGSRRSQVWGVCGGSGSGKSTLVGMLRSALPAEGLTVLHFDAYYRDLSHLPARERAAMNFDHPDSLEIELLLAHLDALLAGRPASLPHYDFAAHSRREGSDLLTPAPLILVEGILLYAFPELVDRFDYRLFIDVPERVRLERRIARDVVTRGRSEPSVREQFARTVAPMHWEYVQPGLEAADRVVRYGDRYEDVARELADRATPLLQQWGLETP